MSQLRKRGLRVGGVVAIFVGVFLYLYFLWAPDFAYQRARRTLEKRGFSFVAEHTHLKGFNAVFENTTIKRGTTSVDAKQVVIDCRYHQVCQRGQTAG